MGRQEEKRGQGIKGTAMKAAVVMSVLALGLAVPLRAQNLYYVYNGATLHTVHDDPTRASCGRWAIWLFKEGSSQSALSSHWGEIDGRSAQSVIAQLKASQSDEKAYERFFGHGSWGPDTAFNPLGPICLSENMPKPGALETIDRVNDLWERMNRVSTILQPALKDWNCAGLRESNPCKLYFGDSVIKQQLDGIMNAYKRTSELYGLMSEGLTPSMQQIDLALTQANQAVTMSERNAPIISSRLSSGGDSSSNQQYAPPIDASSVRQFYDPQTYNWLSFENTSSEGISITFIPKIPGHGGSLMELRPGSHGNTGRSAKEVEATGGFELYVCPLGYIPVDANNRYVNKTNTTDFKCKRQ